MKLKNEKYLGIYLDKELYDYIKKLADINRTSISSEVRKLILEKYKDGIKN